MYRPCYYDVKHGLVISQKQLNQECYSLNCFNSLTYFRTEIEALICRELLKLQKQLMNQQCDYQIAVKKRASFEYLPGYNNYSPQIYRFAFSLDFYHIADIWKQVEQNTWGIKRELGDSPWEPKFKKLILETLNDMAVDSGSKKIVANTIYIDYMKNSDNRPEQSLCFHVAMLNENLRHELKNKCFVVIDKQLSWYDVPFPTTDLSGLGKAVIDAFMVSINSDGF